MTATQLGKTLLPDLAETDFHLQALHQVLAFRRLKLRKVPWKELRKNRTEIATMQQTSVANIWGPEERALEG